MLSLFIFFGEKGMKETGRGGFKEKLVKKLKSLYPGCIIISMDPQEHPGIPDLLILYNNKWVALETKRSKTAAHRPNQDWYVAKMKDMSYAAFIFPENEEAVLNEIRQTFGNP